MNDLVSEYQQYQDASVDEEEFDEEEEAEDAEWIVLIAEFKMPRRRRQRQRERQKSNRLRLAKPQQQLCTRVTLFLYISLPFLHDYVVKKPWIWFLGIRLQKRLLAFNKASELGISR